MRCFSPFCCYHPKTLAILLKHLMTMSGESGQCDPMSRQQQQCIHFKTLMTSNRKLTNLDRYLKSFKRVTQSLSLTPK